MENLAKKIILSNPEYFLTISASDHFRTATLIHNKGLKLRTVAELDPGKSEIELIQDAEKIIRAQAG